MRLWYGRGTVEFRSWYGRGAVTVRSRYSRGSVVVRSWYGCGAVRYSLGTLPVCSWYGTLKVRSSLLFSPRCSSNLVHALYVLLFASCNRGLAGFGSPGSDSRVSFRGGRGGAFAPPCRRLAPPWKSA